MNATKNKKKKLMNGNGRTVANEKEINSDLNCFNPVLYMDEKSSLRLPIRLLAVLGHAQSGHARFKNKEKINTTILDVLYSVAKDHNSVEKIRRNVSSHIDEAKKILDELTDIAIGKKTKEKSFLYDQELEKLTLINKSNRFSFGGFKQFSPDRYVIESPQAFLRGAYIASQMDSLERRVDTMNTFEYTMDEKRKIIIGGGSCHVGNLKIINDLGIKINEFSNSRNTPNQIDNLYLDNILTNKKYLHSSKSDKYNSYNINVYIREEIGFGCCDDASLLGIGLQELSKSGSHKRAIDAFHGGALIDTIDTIDKISAFPVTGGADEYIGERINKRYKESKGRNLASDKDVETVIYFGAKNNTPNIKFSDSVRRFHELTRINKRGILSTPFDSHLSYLKNDIVTVGLNLGFERVKSENFYQQIEDRIKFMQKMNLFANFE